MRQSTRTILLLLSLLAGIAQAAPTFQASGTVASGTGSVSPSWPTHAIGDVALLFVESAGGEPVTLSTSAGFVQVANSPQATGSGTSGTQITVFWARATSTSMAAPTISDPGNHAYSQIITYRGVINSGNPWDVTSGGIKATASGSVTVTGVTTTVPDTLIVQAVSRDLDSSAAAFSAEANANLTGITERADAGTTSGNGGGFAIWDGAKATAGATGNTTATVTSSLNAFLTIALKPLPPSVVSMNAVSSNPTAGATSVSWTVVFDQTVTGVDAADFVLVQSGGVSGAAITGVTGSGTTYTVTASTGSGTGSLGLDLIDDDSIKNAAGTPLGGAGTGNGNFTGDVYTVSPTFCSPPSNIPSGVSVSCVCDTFDRATLNPSTIFGSNWIQSTSDGTGILPDIVNAGYLRLTNNTGNNAKAVTVPGIFPAAGNYISVEFQHYAYHGTNPGADGVAVTLSDYSVPAVPGAYGGSLGYAQETGIHDGFAGGWIGVALDEWGNYQNPTEGRVDGPGFIAQSVGMRGSGSAQTGYHWLGGTTSLTPTIDNHASTTAAPGYFYQVIVDARGEPTSTSVTVNRDISGTGTGYTSLISVPNVYTAATSKGFTQNPVPTNWQISFTGSTGGSNNIHELGSVRICAQNVVPTSGGTASGFSAIDEAYGNASASPYVAVQNYLNGHIFTKLMGTPFKLNVAAITNNQIVTTYAATGKTVTVKLVDNSDSISDSTKDCTLSCTGTCIGKPAVAGGTQTLAFVSSDKGQKQSGNFTVNTAYQKLVAVISDGTTNACSTDSFAVRPTGIGAVTSSASGASAVKAGSQTFTISAAINGVSGSNNGYNGVLKLQGTSVTASAPATVAGSLAGSFSAGDYSAAPTSTSIATGSFIYSEVGAFKILGPNFTVPRIPGIYDDTWTGVDSIGTKNDCVSGASAAAYSNTKDGTGKYGCYFGYLADTSAFGRFIPDHFDTVVNPASGIPMPCPTGITPSCPLAYNGFVYSGQPFTVTVTAMNGLAIPTPTVNYNTTTGLSKSVTLSAWGTLGSTATPDPGPGGLTGAGTPTTPFSAGVATYKPTYTFSTVPTAPADIYVRADETAGADGVSSLRTTNPLATSVEGGVKVLSGRIKVSNAYGSELLPLTLTASAQYYAGTTSGWVGSATDSVTALTFATSYAVGSGTTPVTLTPATSILAAGNLTVLLGKPSAGVGTATINPVAPAYLPVISGTATFGVYKNNSNFIYRRER